MGQIYEKKIYTFIQLITNNIYLKKKIIFKID